MINPIPLRDKISQVGNLAAVSLEGGGHQNEAVAVQAFPLQVGLTSKSDLRNPRI